MASKNITNPFHGLQIRDKRSIEKIFKENSGKVIHQIILAKGTIADAKKVFIRTMIELSDQIEKGMSTEVSLEDYLLENCLRNWPPTSKDSPEYDLNSKADEAVIAGDSLKEILTQLGEKYFFPDQKYIIALMYDHRAIIEEIYSQNAQAISSYIVKNSGTIADAQDIFQDALMALYHVAEEGFVLPGPFKKYLFGICRYMWLDRLRKAKKKKIEENSYSTVTNFEKQGQIIEAPYSAIALKEEEYSLFIEKFKGLSPHCQEIIGLSWTANEETGKANSLIEIAEMLSRDYGYIRKEKSVCIKKLIARIKEDPRYNLLKTLDLWTITTI